MKPRLSFSRGFLIEAGHPRRDPAKPAAGKPFLPIVRQQPLCRQTGYFLYGGSGGLSCQTINSLTFSVKHRIKTEVFLIILSN